MSCPLISGPMAEPWSTPDVSGERVYLVPSIPTLWSLSIRVSSIFRHKSQSRNRVLKFARQPFGCKLCRPCHVVPLCLQKVAKAYLFSLVHHFISRRLQLFPKIFESMFVLVMLGFSSLNIYQVNLVTMCWSILLMKQVRPIVLSLAAEDLSPVLYR